MTTETLDQIEKAALSEREHDHYEEIKRLERDCDRLEGVYETAKAEAGAAKKEWEGAVASLRATIRRGPDAQAKLPFREDWRDVPIGDAITLTEKQAEKLEEFGIRTVGDFEKQRGGEGLTAIPGVGEATAEKWADQVMDFVAQAARDAEAEEPDDQEDEDFDDEDEEGDE
jgi:hypothetical protein